MTAAPRPITAAGRRVGWGFADQGLSSLTNLVISLAAARLLSPQEFGAFALTVIVYQAFLVLGRSVSGDQLLMLYAGRDEPERRRAIAKASGAVAVGSCVLAFGLASVGWMVAGALGTSILALAFCLPGLLIQDVWRFGFVANGTPVRAFLNDLAWLTLLALSLAAVVASVDPSSPTLILAWGASASVAAFIGATQNRFMPNVRGALAWVRERPRVTALFLVEYGTTAGGIQLSSYLVAAIAGLVPLAALRAAGVILGPITVIIISMSFIVVPEVARLHGRRPSMVRPAVFAGAAAVATAAVVWGSLLAATPERVGTFLLGENWHPARSVLFPMTIAVAADAAVAVLSAGSRAVGSARSSLKIRAVAMPLVVAGVAIGAWQGSATGAAFGLAGANLVALVPAARVFSSADNCSHVPADSAAPTR